MTPAEAYRLGRAEALDSVIRLCEIELLRVGYGDARNLLSILREMRANMEPINVPG